MTAHQTTSASYEVGYRKPPRHTQFQKGHSGNPGGRPRRLPAERLEELALYEAYRTTIVMEDGHAIPMPAIQAVLRRQLESAASGNVRAQRDILAMVRDIERVRSIASLFDNDGADAVVDDTDDADAIDGDDNADRDDAGGADDDEPARQQADGIDTHGERRQAEREPVEPVARVERSETREHPLNAAPPPPGFAGAQPGLQRSSQLVARVERSETREHPLNAAPPPPGFADAQPGLQQSSSAAPPAVRAPQPENAAALPAGRTPSLPSGSRSGQRQGVPSRRNGPQRSLLSPPPLAGEGQGGGQFHGTDSRQDPPPQPSPASGGGGDFPAPPPAPPRPGRRRRSPAVNAGKIREGSSRRSPGRTNTGPGPAQAAGRHARAPATPAERDEKLKIPC